MFGLNNLKRNNMKYLFNFAWFLIIMFSMMPFLGMLLISTIVYWDGKYIERGNKIIEDTWDNQF